MGESITAPLDRLALRLRPRRTVLVADNTGLAADNTALVAGSAA